MEDGLFGDDVLGLDGLGVDSDAFGELVVDSLMSRSCSDMSTASTVSARGSAEPALVIEAFCTFNRVLVHIDYPNASNGWIYRMDLGGCTTHRWDLAGEVSIVAKHSKCAKAMRPKLRPCRNCEHVKWHLECLEACNTFIIFALHDEEAAFNALAPLVLSTPTISDEDVQLYSAFVRKVQCNKRAYSIDEVRARKKLHRERNLRVSLFNGGTGRVDATYDRRRFAGDDLLQLLMDANADDRGNVGNVPLPTVAACADDIVDDASRLASSSALAAPPAPPLPVSTFLVPEQAAFPHLPPSASLSSEYAPLILSAPYVPLLATPTASKAEPVVATVASSPTRNRDVALEIYECILEALIDFGSDDTVTMAADFLADLSSRLSGNLHGIVATLDSKHLTYLYGILGVDHEPTLVVKTSLLQLWINQAACVGRAVCVHIGFLSMHATTTFDEIRTLPLMPCVLTQRELHMHPSYDLAASACLPGTHPVACAYFSPHAPWRVYAATVLPLGF
jgi:hypothetical protein